MKHFILGGARSGKSSYAGACALATGKTPYIIATGQAGDSEMSARIAHHQAQRDARWTLVEEPLKLAQSLAAIDNSEHCVVVDCLTLWLSNCLAQGCWESEKQQLLSSLNQLQSDIILVSNEVGGGIVPLGELARLFVDESGWLNQNLAGQCSHVTTVIAGLPMTLKEPETP